MAKRYTTIFTLCAAALLLGCEDGEMTGVDELPEDAVAFDRGGVSASATGGGWLEKELLPIQFSFSAIQKSSDGSAKGRFHYSVEFGGDLIEFYGQVTCLTVDPANGRAWVGGVITQNNSTHPFWLRDVNDVGDDIWFRVEDNDQGSGATDPDLSTFVGFEGNRDLITSREYCDAMLWPADDEGTNRVTQGNIQVRVGG